VSVFGVAVGGVAVGGVAVGGVAVGDAAVGDAAEHGGGGPYLLALPPEQGVIDCDDRRLHSRHQQRHHRAGDAQAEVVGISAGVGEEAVRPLKGPGLEQARHGRLAGARPGFEVGDGEVGGAAVGDGTGGREDEPVGTGETPELEVGLETLALGWLLPPGASPGSE
jgi:hypothetical protein